MMKNILLINFLAEVNTFLEKHKFSKESFWGRSQDGGGVGRGDHFLFYKFIERTTER